MVVNPGKMSLQIKKTEPSDGVWQKIAENSVGHVSNE